jgi:uncharacterized membrane protein YgcG
VQDRLTVKKQGASDMDAMALEVESNAGARASLELMKGSWKKSRDDRRLAAAQPPRGGLLTSVVDSTIPRCAASDPTLSALMGGRVCVMFNQDYHKNRSKETRVTVTEVTEETRELPLPPPSPPSATTSSPTTDSDSFRLTKPRNSEGFKLPLRSRPDQNPRPGKRQRHRLDVDGPNTADLCCKKRRLRTVLITSRLSQPYSQPATHILNREGQKHGDKRFLKMATSLDISRRRALAQSTSFLRYSVMNRLRERLGLGKLTEQQGQCIAENKAGLEDMGAKAPWKAQGSLAALSSRHVARAHRTAAHVGGLHAYPHPPQHGTTSPRLQSTRLSMPAALPLPPTDAKAAKSRTSARIHPVRSPELLPERGACEELEEDGFAFLYGDDDLTDDPDHVYSDFSVIFGGGGGGGSGGSGGGSSSVSGGPSGSSDSHAQDDSHSYEEYLDELDGISWVAM